MTQRYEWRRVNGALIPIKARAGFAPPPPPPPPRDVGITEHGSGDAPTIKPSK